MIRRFYISEFLNCFYVKQFWPNKFEETFLTQENVPKIKIIQLEMV